MSTTKLTTRDGSCKPLRIGDLEDGDFFLRRTEKGGEFGLRVEDRVVFFYGNDAPALCDLSTFKDEQIERYIDSVEIIER